ncbi:MAG: RNA-directed DNA polymerase, partial [Thiovulaceae bacterium]|nr:RNA-directed DNA polymerase [Sulfurimonadaceae bacterium]
MGDTDVFPAPFEYQALSSDWDNVKSELLTANVLDWRTRPGRSLLSPKAKYGFRTITQLDPLDFLVYSALVYEISTDLENRRVPVEAQIVFSYRVSTNRDGCLFDANIGYRQYLDRCRVKVGGETAYNYVAVTDISDFYSRIYHHRLENALRAATSNANHVSALMRLLSGWNGTETFGIPVGCAPSRLLAEIALSDVDEAMRANGIDFVRFNDDYRIFARSETEAYQHLTFLASTLFSNHGLSLQQQKTDVLPVNEFRRQFLATPLDREMDSLHEKFAELIEELGLESWYEEIDYDDLNTEQQELVDSLNLVALFREEAESEEPDIPVVKFCLRRLGQLGDQDIVEDIFDNLESLLPAFVDVIEYFKNLRFLNPQSRSSIGGRLIGLLENSIVSGLPYHRMWIVDIFTENREWDNEHQFVTLYNNEIEQVCRRKLILAMGRAAQQHWFQSQWRSLFEHP